MNISIWKDIIGFVRGEEQRRSALLTKGEDPDIASYQWRFEVAPFVNELCLMMLVALRHQVERELVLLLARAVYGGQEITGEQYLTNVGEERNKLRGKDGWKRMNDMLKLESCAGYKFVEVLRLLANSYKHNPAMEADVGLVNDLDLEDGLNERLPDSESLQEGLAAFIGLPWHASYCDVAERFVDIARDFLADVRNRTKISPIRWKFRDPLAPDTLVT